MTTTDKPVGNAARVRLRLLAAFLPVTAALYVGAEALDPKGTDEVVTRPGTIPAARNGASYREMISSGAITTTTSTRLLAADCAQ